MKKLLILGVIISGIILTYGYWHSVTHGSVNIDLAYKASNIKKLELLPLAEVAFMNGTGKILAKGISDEKSGYIQLISPDNINCNKIIKPYSKEGRKLWKDCFNKQAVWIPKWINHVSQVKVKHKNCISKNIPVVISEHNTEWFLWWVPLPHVGGIPYSYFRASIIIEENDCIE